MSECQNHFLQSCCSMGSLLEYFMNQGHLKKLDPNKDEMKNALVLASIRKKIMLWYCGEVE